MTIDASSSFLRSRVKLIPLVPFKLGVGTEEPDAMGRRGAEVRWAMASRFSSPRGFDLYAGARSEGVYDGNSMVAIVLGYAVGQESRDVSRRTIPHVYPESYWL